MWIPSKISWTHWKIWRNCLPQTNTAKVFCLVFLVLHCPCWEIWVALPYLGKPQQLQEQRYPFLPVCVGVLWVKWKIWLPVLGIFNTHTDVEACDCTRGLYKHQDSKRVCTGSWLWEKTLLPHQGLKPTSVLCLAFSRMLYQLSYPCPSSQCTLSLDP